MLSRSIRALKVLTVIACIGLSLTGCAIDQPVTPAPAQVQVRHGQFVVKDNVRIFLQRENKTLRNAATVVEGLLGEESDIGVSVGTGTQQPDGAIVLSLVAGEFDPEGYRLSVDESGVEIEAATDAGFFYAVQTLRQLRSGVTAGDGDAQSATIRFRAISIFDEPRFRWRGFMLDESRHFRGVAYVKKLLDQMAALKLNRFHWHLTDEQGWRVQILDYPRLTSVGAIGNHSDPEAPGAFYTQDEIREIVDYAKERYIEIIPEIDMPGHATAAARAYPEYSGGGSEERPHFTFNPGSDATYRFLTDILTEVATLFPFPWIHYGGDEVHYANAQWADIPEVQDLMEREGLQDLKEVEYYFNNRMANEINKLGRMTMAWDEVADSGVPPEQAAVMWWRHDKPEKLFKALDSGFNVVICPRRPYYFDFVQHESHEVGRRWDGFNDLKQVYDGPLVLNSLSGTQMQKVMGLQANLWTETVQTEERADFMIFPRIMALAESAWSAQDAKDFTDFQRRLKSQLKQYDNLGINYFNPFDENETPEPLH